MSKKTIYVHFPGKEAILDTIAHRLQGQLATRIDRVLEDDTLEFPERLTGVIEGVFRTLRRIRPGVFEEFKRYAPAVFERIDAVRMELIPRVFGQLMREGMAGGYIRQDIDPKFAALAWMQLVRGMTDAEIMDRTGLSPSQTVKQAFELFWPGVLTDSGRQALTRSQPGEGSP